MLYDHDGHRPRVHRSAVIAPTATICGDVIIGAQTCIQHGATVVAEGTSIQIGTQCVVLENADMNACYVLESRNLDAEVRQPFLRSERGLRDLWCQQLQKLRPELSSQQARTMVQMAVFAVVGLCVYRNRMARAELIELATAQVLGALRGPVSTSTSTSKSN